MNYTKLFFHAMFINSFLVTTITCSGFEQTKEMFEKIKIEEDSNDYNKIIYEYTHGNPDLLLTKNNCIVSRKKLILYSMNFSNKEANTHRTFREAHLQGKSTKLLPRPIPKSNTESLKKLIDELANK